MGEVRFYQLGRRPLEQALTVMLERCYRRGRIALVQAGSAERVEDLATYLWTYRERSFLPHGTQKDGFADRQPIWLTAEVENPNGAEVLFLTDGVERADLGGFALVVVLFDGGNDQRLKAAREYWRRLRESGRTLTYWAEDESGHWTQKM
ncbi:MAG: DNA polymerase III subunit chi [Rhodospirillales bacterium]|nr:DNA polymerase III subunit chi [Rhodospirillales bacterium]